MADEDPLIKALPPATDYLTYLTILEYQLTPARLPTLHEVLQDERLTSNIGWDLLHLLLPLLPASEQCLQDVARLGNPREVILKAIEALQGIGSGEAEGGDGHEDIGEGPTEAPPKGEEGLADDGEGSSKADLGVEGAASNTDPPQDPASDAASLDLPTLQFNCLLSVLSILHPRIMTKYPSRFLATSLQAILAAYPRVCSPVTTTAALEFVRTLSGRKRPTLPPRLSGKETAKFSTDDAAPDPEAQAEPPTPEELAVQQRLLQSFLTHTLEEYIGSYRCGDVLGMAWTGRIQEKLGSMKLIPGRSTYTQRFTDEEDLKDRDFVVGQITALCRDLRIDSDELVMTLTQPPKEEPDEDALDALPSDPADIPLSQTGSLYLLAARTFYSIVFQTGAQTASPVMPIFPTHAILVTTFIGASTISSIGSEHPSVIDAILMLGFVAVHNDQIGTPETDEDFTQYLQILSSLSANTPDPQQRYNAHSLTSAVLHSHSSPSVRLDFIRDTLENCPFDNLKSSAVAWLKTEIMAAAAEVSTTKTEPLAPPAEPSLFLTPSTLRTLFPLLFPSLASNLLTPPVPLAWEYLQLNLSSYLAALNFLYFLLASPTLVHTLQVAAVYREHNVEGRFISVLGEASERFRGFLSGEWGEGALAGTDGDDGVGRGLGELELLGEVVERVEALLKEGEGNGVNEKTGDDVIEHGGNNE